MLDSLIERIQALGPEIKSVITVVIALLGVIFIAKPATKCMQSFSDAKWMQGIVWLCAGLAVIAISVGAIAILFGWGQELGTGMEEELGFIFTNVLNS
ncbi:hypothetical protein ACY2DA_13295 [Staphylococcus simulans]